MCLSTSLLLTLSVCVCVLSLQQAAVDALTATAVEAVMDGADVIILSDKTSEGAVGME